ncbi:MAG: helix-turn-helix domain-containing protein [Clostridiales bacterium]|jgi:transcriptional regulator with XRE-family HTH domain|nr:helix-turn-helix domain-containing protein [Clostridiales bacterium]
MKEITLGEKIKEARLSKKLTQNEVVGDFITRNMLSKIENDSATPSVRTIEYLANKLELPVSYFMSSLFESYNDENSSSEEKIKKSHLLQRMYQEFDNPENFLRISEDFMELMKDPSDDDRYMFLTTEFYIENGELEKAKEYIKFLNKKGELTGFLPADTFYLSGLLAMKELNFTKALSSFEKALTLNPESTLSDKIYASCEKCCIEQEDYKKAYLYSSMRFKKVSNNR